MEGNGRTSGHASAAHLRDLPVFLRAPRAAGLWLVGVLIPLATVAALTLSYRGLFDWARYHGWPWYLAPLFPLLIDVLIVAGEVVLFNAAIEGKTPWRVRAAAWVIVLVFTALSVIGNVGHAATSDVLTRGGWGLPPVVLAIALGFGLGELKRQAAKYRDAGPEPVRVTEGQPPSEWLDDRILALLPRMSVRSTADAFGVSKTRVETAKRRAALTPLERNRDGVATPAVAAPAGDRPRPLAGAPVASSNGRTYGT
jgi:hypothetical protein